MPMISPHKDGHVSSYKGSSHDLDVVSLTLHVPLVLFTLLVKKSRVLVALFCPSDTYSVDVIIEGD